MSKVRSEIQPSRAEIDALSGATLLEFGSPGCGYCRAAQPLIDAALSAHPRVGYIKVTDASGLSLGRSFRVKQWPSLIFLRDGEEIGRLVRPGDTAMIRRSLAKIDGGEEASHERSASPYRSGPDAGADLSP